MIIKVDRNITLIIFFALGIIPLQSIYDIAFKIFPFWKLCIFRNKGRI